MGSKLCTTCDCNKTEQGVELDLRSSVRLTQQFTTERMTTRESSIIIPSEKRPARLLSVQSVRKVTRIQAVWRGYQDRKQFVHIKKQAVAVHPYFSDSEVRETLDKRFPSTDREFTYTSGGKYIGQWRGGFRHGRGVMMWPDGAHYDGQWEYGKPCGKGTFTHIDGEQYQGAWRGKDGFSDFYTGWLEEKTEKLRSKRYIPNPTSRLEGELAGMRIRLDGMESVIDKLKTALGKGFQPMGGTDRTWKQVQYPTGMTYEGEMAGDQRDGRGKTTWTNGETYEGDWKDDMQSGYGKNVWADGSLFHGQYYNNLKQGVGLYQWEDGSHYLGEWRADKMAGVGKYVWPQGKVYTGQWLAGVFHGVGELVTANGRRFLGEWQQGKKHGVGVTFLPNGSVTVEEWLRGKAE